MCYRYFPFGSPNLVLIGPIITQRRTKKQVCKQVGGVTTDLPAHHQDDVCEVLGIDLLDHQTQDGYDFFLKAGPVRNLAAIMETSGAMAGGSETPGGCSVGRARVHRDRDRGATIDVPLVRVRASAGLLPLCYSMGDCLDLFI